MKLKQIIRHEYSYIGGVLLLIVSSFKLAFLPTFSLWIQNRDLNKQMLVVQAVHGQPDFLYRKNIYLDSVLAGYKADTVNYGTYLISRVTGLADSSAVVITEVPGDNDQSQSGTMLFRKFKVEGQYAGILKFISDSEQAAGLGKLCSLTIQELKEQNGTVTPSDRLSADLVFEIIRKPN